jgi:glycosyltransferase involved in cell wall biosynthesis
MTRAFQESVFQYWIVRLAVSVFFLCRGTIRQLRGRRYRALLDFCWIERVSDVTFMRRIVWRRVVRIGSSDAIVQDFRRDPISTQAAAAFALDGTGSNSLFRDLLVLKSASRSEKGVILLKYAKTFDAVQALLDVTRLMDHYTLVLEPCWAGYCDPSILMFTTARHPVIVQCFTEADYRFIAELGQPMVPVRLGPADWVDAELFKPFSIAKNYDVVMVANWASHKRHSLLFDALASVRHRSFRVLLIGFPWAGRTADDVRREAQAVGNPNVTIEVIENLPPGEVARHVSQAKAFVFLSRKEGDNKALVEAMFTDVPAVVYAKTIGGATSRINPHTGVLADEQELGIRILEVIDHGNRFAPRKWAISHTGSAVATRTLDQAIAAAVHERGGLYTTSIVEKTNAPNLTYKDPQNRTRFQADYDFILSCRLDSSASVATAVA